MSVYYFNGAQILAPYTITSNEPIYDVDTVSLSKQRASQGVQRWEISFNTVTSAETEAEMLVGMVTGLTTADTMPMPQLPSVDVANTIGLNRTVTTPAAAGSSSVTIDSNGILSKGSFVKFGNHAKIYMVTADVGAGTVSVPIYPSLRKAQAAPNTMRTGSSAIFTYYRDIDNSRGISFNDGVLSSAGLIRLVEGLV